MKTKMFYPILKASILLLLLWEWGCNQNPSRDDDFRKQRPYSADPIISLTSTPREGWATDPNLSYRLFSYYPINYYNNNLYQTIGIYGLYYH